MLKIGIESAAYFSNFNYEEGLKKMQEHGFNCCDYAISGEPVDSFSDKEYIDYLLDLKRCADKNNIEFFQAHGNRDSISSQENFEINNFLMRQLITCKTLGCKNLVMHPYTDGYVLNGDSHETIFNANKKIFTMLADNAKDYDVTICVENLPFRWYEMCRVPAVKALINEISHPNLKACFDTGHANVMREDIYKSIKLLGDDLRVLHVHDNFGTEDDRHYLPFRGNVDWNGFVKGLKEIGYSGAINLETRISIDTPEPMRDLLRRGLAGIARYFAEQI